MIMVERERGAHIRGRRSGGEKKKGVDFLTPTVDTYMERLCTYLVTPGGYLISGA